MEFLGLKLGLDLEMRAAHPTKNFNEYPPPPGFNSIDLEIMALLTQVSSDTRPKCAFITVK